MMYKKDYNQGMIDAQNGVYDLHYEMSRRDGGKAYIDGYRSAVANGVKKVNRYFEALVK